MPSYEALVKRGHSWLAVLLEVATPILLCLTIVYVVIVQINDNAKFDAQAAHDRSVACAAVSKSNAATVSFLRTRIASTSASPAQSAAGGLFVDGLEAAYKVVDTACLAAK